MPRKKTPGGLQWSFHTTEAVLVRADKLAKKFSQPGLALTRTDAIRMALERGMQELEKHHADRT